LIKNVVAGRGWVEIGEQQHLPYFPARKINSVRTNKTKSDLRNVLIFL
jgi:hypothetical protein